MSLHVSVVFVVVTACSIATTDGAIVEGAIRLVNGNNASEGRVEIYLQGQWGTICDNLWDIREATVVCKQLGFLDAISAVGSAEFGEGSGPIQLDDLNCVGNETALIHCSARPIQEHSCTHSEDAGVRCNPQTSFYLRFEEAEYSVGEEDGSLEVVLVLDKPAANDVTIQIMDANNTATGDEDYVTGPYSVTINEGETKASLSVGIINDKVFENGNGNNGEQFSLAIVPFSLPDGVYLGHINKTTCTVTILDDEYTFCFESESYLIKERGETVLNVALNRPLRKDIMVNFTYIDLTATGNHTITNQAVDYYTSHEYPNLALIPAGTQLFQLNVRVEDDRRLEDYELFRIITGPPDLPEGEVPCATDVIIRDDDDFVLTFDKASYTVRENEDVTVGLSLIYPDEYDAAIMFPINVTIDEIDILTTGGLTDDTEGADYVFQNYSYSFKDREEKKLLIIRTIDDNIVEPDEAYILFINTPTSGFSPALPVSRVIVGENGTATITIVNDDAIVEGATRLVNGNNASEGRVEIYLQGQWGTICDDHWDIREATVVCKQLGFLDAISAVGNAEFGEGSGPIQLDDLNCVGNETALINCSTRPIKQHNCAHSEDAGVRCNNCSSLDGGWSKWKNISECSVTCGEGIKVQTRSCSEPPSSCGGKYCDGPGLQFVPCNVSACCPVNGNWSEWRLGPCSKTCGGGIQNYTRVCDSPEPSCGGKECDGLAIYTPKTKCNDFCCPVDGGWGKWKRGPCSKTCGGGRHRYTRKCNRPKPSCGGKKCDGRAISLKRKCNNFCCPVNGGWNEWVFGPCSKSCGGGLQNITRECNRPKPECNGKDCDGPNYYAFPIKCNNFFCPGVNDQI